MKATKEIQIYLNQKRNVRQIDLVQYDTGIQLVFSVLDFAIPSEASATLYVQKPSGKFVFQEDGITISGNKITVDLENQAITEHGRVPYQISLNSGTDVITTFTGLIMVEKSLKDAGATEPQTTESRTVVGAFDDAVSAHVAEFQAKAEQIVQACIATIPADYSSMEAKVGEAANAVKGYLSGAVVTADDVSPVEHNPIVKVVCPDGVDPNTVTVRRCGKNIFGVAAKSQTQNGVTFTINDDGSVTANGTATKTTFLGLGSLVLKPDEQYRLSGSPAGSSFNTYLLYIHNSTTGADTYDLGEGKAFTGADGDLGVTIAVYAGNTVNNLIFRPMVVYGEEDGTFEPYNGAEYIPVADGTVPGITSVSPCMTILTDTEGVIVECEYNRDTNKVIDKLTNAIKALGGTI